MGPMEGYYEDRPQSPAGPAGRHSTPSFIPGMPGETTRSQGGQLRPVPAGREPRAHKAIDRFEPDRGSKFTSYAAPTILGELKRHFRDKGWALHVPRDLQERTLAVSRETEALSKRLGRSPKPREVAQALGCSVEQVLEAQEAAGSYEAASLDAPPARHDDLQSAALLQLLGDEDTAYELVEEREAIASSWKTLPDLERNVLDLALRARPHPARDRRADRLLAHGTSRGWCAGR